MKKTTYLIGKGTRRFSSGMAILDILLAMVVFAVGMLALAQLQSNLTRSSADSSFRTLATNLGEQTLESLRAYQLVRSDPDGLLFAFADIDSDFVTKPEMLGNVNFNVTGSVVGYDINIEDDGSVTYTEADPAVAGEIYDLKHVVLNVSWDAGSGFQVGDETTLSGQEMGTGSITVTGVIPSIPSLASAKVNSDTDAAGGPPVNYDPLARPDVVPIQIDQQKFKESSTPEPIVRRELMETWFDVVTYSQVQGEETTSIFLRREEFVTISCECELRSKPAGEVLTGFPPAIWTGAEYKVGDGEMVNKAYGVQNSTGLAQSLYCNTCCRDHHDTDSGYKVKTDYNGGGDHPHYYRDGSGELQTTQPHASGPVKLANTYVEACRLVRKDGFFRVAQDLNLYENNAFPEEYLTTDGDISEYSSYVASIANSELGNGGSPGSAQSRLTYSGRDQSNRSAVGDSGQQLRSRGIYVDEMNAELDANITNCFGNGDRSLCEAPHATSELELYPFFDIQVTHLARWSETYPINPVTISNQEIPKKAGEIYSRGKASLSGGRVGGATGHSIIEKGNVGLISTASIAKIPQPEYDQSDIYLMAGGDPTPPNPSGFPEVSGNLFAQGLTADAADLAINGSAGVTCFKPTNETFGCLVDPSTIAPTLTVSGYWRLDTTLIVCNVGGLIYQSHTNGNELTNKTVFLIDPVVNTSGINLTLIAGGSNSDCLLP